MLTAFDELLRQRRPGTAVGAFTAYDLEGAVAALRAADETGAGAIILLGSRSYASRDGQLLLAALLAAAARSSARVCVQLDHCNDMTLMESALDAGAGAVMADGARLGYEENVEFVVRAVEMARRYGACVEAELGWIAGDEDIAVATDTGALTDPKQAAEFVARTDVDCLAVSIGNVHGTYRATPVLDWDLLASIRAATAVPLSLHGASGLRDATVHRAIAMGIAKVNVNTELRSAYLAATADAIGSVIEGSRLAALHGVQIEAVRGAVAAKLRALNDGQPAASDAQELA